MDRHRPLPPEPGDGGYFFVGILAVVVVILGIVVVNHPSVGPVRAVGNLLGLQPTSTAPPPPPDQSTGP